MGAKHVCNLPILKAQDAMALRIAGPNHAQPIHGQERLVERGFALPAPHGKLVYILQVLVQDLDAVVPGVRNVQIAIGAKGKADRLLELAGAIPGAARCRYQIALRGILADALVACI